MTQASQNISQQFKDGGVVPAELVGQSAVSKTYVDGQLADRDQDINSAITAAGEANKNVNDLSTRVDHIVASAGDSNTEIVDARQPATGTAFTTLGSRLNDLDKRIDQVVDLFAMSGQSNMQGQSEAAPTPFEIPQYKAYEYKLLTNTLTTVKHPFGENIGELLAAPVNDWGSLSPRFAEGYFNTTGIPPLMVGVAKGSTTVEQWINNSRYSKVVEKVNAAAIKAVDNGLVLRRKCFVWLQGESDGVLNTTKIVYKQRLLQLWNDLKRDCGFTHLLIIRVAKFFDNNVVPIIKAQEELAREQKDIVMLTRITGTFTTGNGLMQSNWHYSNAGLDLVGSLAGKAAGNFMNTNVRPMLETEPYSDVVSAVPGRYAWNFRTGTITGGITLTSIGTPVVSPTYITFDAVSGYKLSKDINLDGDATISITCLFTLPTNTGAVFTSYNGGVDQDFVFMHHLNKVINISPPDGSVIASFTETETITPVIGTYNHYLIQKVGRIYTLFFNGKQIQSVFNGPEVLNINTLFYGDFNLGLKGRVKHCMVHRGGVIAPRSADPEFYSGAEQGTT